MPSISGIMMSISTMSMSGSVCRMRIASRPLSAETITMSCSSSTVDSAKMLRMSSSTISTFLPAQQLVGLVQVARASAAWLRAACRRCGAGRTRPGRAAAPASGPGGRVQAVGQALPAAVVVGSPSPSPIDDHRQPADGAAVAGVVRAASAVGARSRHRRVERRRSRRVARRSSSQRAGAVGDGGHLHVVGRRRSSTMLVARGVVRLDDQHAAASAAVDELVQVVEQLVEHVPALDRLGQERRAPRSQRPLARLVGRDDADRDVPRRQVVLQPVEHAPAVDVGQEDVERDGVAACTRGPSPAPRRPAT